MDEMALLKELVAVLDKHGLPPGMRLSFLMGLPIGVLKGQGATDEQVREFVNQVVKGALAGAALESK